MFNPEMIEACQKMMANMQPDDRKKMFEMASNMDPSVMQNIMQSKGLGADLGGMDMSSVSEQLKNTSPEQMEAAMGQASKFAKEQKQYVLNGAVVLKNDGNTHIKNEKYGEALEAYNRALDNLKPHAGDDVRQLQLQLMLNAALCHLKRKEHQKAIDRCNEALEINGQSVKAIFRRGLARFELGMLSEALADVKQAARLSPEEKIASELKRLEKECMERGLKESDIQAAEKAAEKAAKAKTQAPTSSPGAPRSLAPGGSSGGGSNPDMAEALDKLSQNPDMLTQATEAMKNMNPDDLQRMMQNSPLLPGVDAETMKSRMEVITKNPDMLKTAVDSFKNMSDDDRKRLLSKQAGGFGGGDVDMSAMSKAFEDPNMLKQVAEMAKGMAGSGDSSEADMMRQAAEQIGSNPELGAQMSEMMKNISPEQMQKMMELSSKMNSKRQASSSSSAAGPGNMDTDAMDAFMNDPDMMKAAEDMMKNISPETLTAMARSSGIELDENKAAMMTKLMPMLPWLMRGMRFFGKVKKGVKGMFSNKGRVIIAIVVLLAALIQHYRSG